MHRKVVLVATALGALALPAGASAHVTLQPDAAPAGQFTRLDVRVPTERPVATKRVVLELPPGFVFASYQPVAGWKVRMATRELVEPVKTDDGEIDHEISRVSWTATSDASAIPPGGFQDFGLAVRIPDGKVGAKLTFKALQAYADGKVVRWIGAPDSENPAPQVTLDDTPDPAVAASARAAAAARPVKAAATTSNDLPSKTLVIAALAAGALGALLGFAGWVAGRRAGM
jgi:periplasmic copper chaperone A